MPFIEWKEEYELGVQEIDRQHKRMFEIINKLHDSANSGEGNLVVSKVIEELLDYSIYHFESEEALYAKLPYPKKQHHTADHSLFKMRVAALRTLTGSGVPPDVVDLLNFGRHWLIQHILKEDMELKEYL